MLQPKQAKRFNLDAIYSEDIVVKVCLLILKHSDDIVLGDLVQRERPRDFISKCQARSLFNAMEKVTVLPAPQS